jgi:hypothetical protein
MINTKEIVDLLIRDQESHEAMVRALHYDMDAFAEWSWGNAKYIAYAFGSLRIKLPINWDENDNAHISVSEMPHSLWKVINENKEEILKQFNLRFNDASIS